jgi:hypothetical protein
MGFGDDMMTVGNSLVATAFACAAFCMTAANAQLGRPTDGRPVMANDLVGKKICWDIGRWNLYGANGQYSDDRGDHPKWSVTEPGLVKMGNSYRQLEILPDGRFYMHSFCGRCGSITGHSEHWGTVCN